MSLQVALGSRKPAQLQPFIQPRGRLFRNNPPTHPNPNARFAAMKEKQEEKAKFQSEMRRREQELLGKIKQQQVEIDKMKVQMKRDEKVSHVKMFRNTHTYINTNEKSVDLGYKGKCWKFSQSKL